MEKKDKTLALVGLGVAGLLAFLLFSRRSIGVEQPVTVTSREYKPAPFSIPPLDLSGLGVVGNTPINWPTTTGITIPPILSAGQEQRKCCSDCSDNSPSSWAQQFVDALALGPPPPYVNTAMLTATEQAAINLGKAQVVYDPTAERGFYVAILPSDLPYAGAQSTGIIYQGAMSVLPPTGPGG